MLSLDTLKLCRELLDTQQVQVGHPTFKETALRTIRAIEELDSAIASAEKPGRAERRDGKGAGVPT